MYLFKCRCFRASREPVEGYILMLFLGYRAPCARSHIVHSYVLKTPQHFCYPHPNLRFLFSTCPCGIMDAYTSTYFPTFLYTFVVEERRVYVLV